MTDKGWGSSLWGELRKVRITEGTIEAPVETDRDGIRIGPAASTPPARSAARPAAGPRRPSLPSRLLRRLRRLRRR